MKKRVYPYDIVALIYNIFLFLMCFFPFIIVLKEFIKTGYPLGSWELGIIYLWFYYLFVIILVPAPIVYIVLGARFKFNKVFYILNTSIYSLSILSIIITHILLYAVRPNW